MRHHRYARLVAGVGLFATLVGGCAHQAALTDAQRAGLPPQVELADTPFFAQERYQCGPAALAMVLNAQGAAATPDALVAEVYLPAREGSLQAEIRAAVRQRSLLAVPVAPALDALLAEIAAGHPVLVLQNLGLDWLPRWHYAVVVGYDLERQELVLRSGTEPRRVTPFGVFLRTWDRAARWGLVVLRPGALPAQPDPVSYLEAASALESVGRPAPARAAYQAATERWPDHALAWLGLGNTEYALNRAAEAEAAFRRALRVQPGSAPAWNNLAYALAARRCMNQAREAVACATHLAPENPAFIETRQELDGRPAAGAQTCPALPACPARPSS